MNKPPTVADVRGILKPYKRIDEMAELRAANERLRAALLSAEKESKYEHFEKHIDRLGDEVRALRAALGPFACNCRVLDCEQRIIPSEQCPRRVARAALGEEKKGC